MEPIYPFFDFKVHYAPLPEHYPKLPLNDHCQQPAAYTQEEKDSDNKGISKAYVSILIPIKGHRKVVLPDTIEFSSKADEPTCVCNILIEEDDSQSEEHQLAMIRGHVEFPANDEVFYQWKIVVWDETAPPNDDPTLGKVVMDANILPTVPV